MHGFIPSPGKINNILFPGGIGVRIDTHIYPGYEVPPYYDSLLAKLIVHAPTRREAVKKNESCSRAVCDEGIATNIEYQYLIMHNTDS